VAKSFSIPLNEQLVQQLHYQNLDPGEAQTHHQLAAHQISNSPYRPQVSISIKFHSFHNPRKQSSPIFKTPAAHATQLGLLREHSPIVLVVVVGRLSEKIGPNQRFF
jgi:hypothetical protein